MITGILSLILAVWAQPATDRTVGSWLVWEVTDPVDDSRRAGAAASGVGGRLRVKCDAAGEGIYVELKTVEYLGESIRRSDDLGRRVMVRFDNDPAVPLQWNYGADYALLQPGAEADTFLTRLRTASRLIVRAKTYQFEDVDIVFELTGSAEALEIVAAGCAPTSTQ